MTSMRSRSGSGIGSSDVGGRDEEHSRQVERHVEVVVAERVVLLGVEHLEQRRRRVAAEVAAELVDLVEHEHRVAGARAAAGPHDLAGHRADIGAAVAADLGLVVHAAERHARRTCGPVARAIERPSEVLPTPGGPTKQSIGALQLVA